MQKLPLLLEKLLGNDAKLVLEFIDRSKSGFSLDEDTRRDFCDELGVTEYQFYKVRKLLLDIGILRKQSGKLFLNREYDLEFQKEWRKLVYRD